MGYIAKPSFKEETKKEIPFMKFEADMTALPGSLIGCNFLFRGWSEPSYHVWNCQKTPPLLRHFLNNVLWVVAFLYHRKWQVYLLISRLHNWCSNCEGNVRHEVGYPPKESRIITAKNQGVL